MVESEAADTLDVNDSTERARVTRRLWEASKFPIAILRGAAGSGKSVGLRQFLLGSDLPYLLYDVPPGHDTLALFVRGLADALGDLAPGARLSFAGAYERALESRDPARDLSAWLREHIKDLNTTIAIDNLHTVESDPQTAAFLTRLIDASPPTLHWILSYRSGDLFPMPGWMAFHAMDVPIEESELAFTLDDIAALAADLGADTSAQGCAAISESTQGWATGVAFLLRSPGEPGPIRAYGPLIERILGGCTLHELRALLSTSYLPEITPSFVAASIDAEAAAAVGHLYARAPYLFVRAGGAMRYHDLLAAELRARLDLLQPADRSTAIDIAARALSNKALYAEAIALYLKSGLLDPVVRILERHGLELIETGHADSVETALLEIERVRHDQPPATIALRAIVESRRGRFDTAESWFNQALARAADDDLQMIEIKYLYACDLMQRFRLDCIPLLAAHARDENVPAHLRSRILSALAQALMLDDQPNAARDAIDEALRIAPISGDDELRARLLARAAYVYQDEPNRARVYAATAAEAAVAASAFSVATGAFSVLYASADTAEEPKAALEYLNLLRENGLKSGNLQFQFYFLACTLEIEAEQGDREALARTDAALESFEIHYDDSTSKEALLPANALRATWSGKFDHAYNLLAPTAATQAAPDRTALRYAEVALYAAAALRTNDCDEAIVRSRSALAEVEAPTNRCRRAHLLSALALSISGRSEEASTAIDIARSGALPARLSALLGVVEALRGRCRGARNHSRIARALEDLHAHDFGGFARLCEALPIHAIFGARVARLSSSDRAALRGILEGEHVSAATAERLRETLDFESVEAMRDSVVRTSAFHTASISRALG
jgi:ATP/maltotriose-dependent transcriptional regulator MalT